MYSHVHRREIITFISDHFFKMFTNWIKNVSNPYKCSVDTSQINGRETIGRR